MFVGYLLAPSKRKASPKEVSNLLVRAIQPVVVLLATHHYTLHPPDCAPPSEHSRNQTNSEKCSPSYNSWSSPPKQSWQMFLLSLSNKSHLFRCTLPQKKDNRRQAWRPVLISQLAHLPRSLLWQLGVPPQKFAHSPAIQKNSFKHHSGAGRAAITGFEISHMSERGGCTNVQNLKSNSHGIRNPKDLLLKGTGSTPQS